MNRREFLNLAAGAGGSGATYLDAAGSKTPVIDTHIHLFDVNRPQGVPWPPKNSSIFKSALPGRYRQLAAPHGVVGAIAIECSPWIEDNQWLLDTAEADPIIVGVIGNLQPGLAEFRSHLRKFQRNSLFRGIRYGNLWGRDLSKQVLRPDFIEDVKVLAEAGLVLDTANPDPLLINAVVRLTDAAPNLTVVVDHLPGMRMPETPEARKACESDLQLLGSRPRVCAKISGIVRRVGDRVPVDVNFYRDQLNYVWGTFGPDRVLFGSDWPNSEQWASYSEVFRLAQDFIAAQDPGTIDKFYRTNSEQMYRWKSRS